MTQTAAGVRPKDFELEIKGLLELRGYVVHRDELIHGTQVDLLAYKVDDLDNTHLIVECTTQKTPVGVEVIKEKAAILLNLDRHRDQLYRVLIVSAHGFTKEAKEFARGNPNIALRTPTEIESQLIDFRPYARVYIADYENSVGIFKEARLAETYVELSVHDDTQEAWSSLGQATDDWLYKSIDNICFILGEYGSGKTSFCRHYVYDLLKAKYNNDEPIKFVPILINLREYQKFFNMQHVITNTLLNQYRVHLSHFSTFERMYEAGHVLLVLDGFDEMANRVNKETIGECFAQIFILAELGCKLLITCRSNFFQSHDDVRRLLKEFRVEITIRDGEQRRSTELSFHHSGRILNVAPLTEVQIKAFAERRFGTGAQELIALLKSVHDLSDLARRPVLLDMILTTLPTLQNRDRPVTSAALYAEYTSRWAARDEWRVRLPGSIRRLFCEHLAWTNHIRKVDEVDLDDLKVLLTSLVDNSERDEEILDQLQNDIQVCSFLTLGNRLNAFRFAHNSFREFFVASHVVKNLLLGRIPEKPDRAEFGATRFFLGLTEVAGFGVHRTYLSSLLSTMAWPATVELQSSRLHSKYWTYDDTTIGRNLRDLVAATVNPGARDTSVEWMTPEIATFISELFNEENVSWQDLSVNQNRPEIRDLIADVLRLGAVPEFIRKNAAAMRNYAVGGTDTKLQTACWSGLFKFAPDLINNDVLTEAADRLSIDCWRYVLFELLDHQEKFTKLINELPKRGKSVVDEAIYHIMSNENGSIVRPVSDLREELVVELSKSGDGPEWELRLALIGRIVKNPRQVSLCVLRSIGNSSHANANEHGVNFLRRASGPGLWRAVRSKSAEVADEALRIRLRDLAEKMRLAETRVKDRVSWNAAKRNVELRERLWSAVRG